MHQFVKFNESLSVTKEVLGKYEKDFEYNEKENKEFLRWLGLEEHPDLTKEEQILLNELIGPFVLPINDHHNNDVTDSVGGTQMEMLATSLNFTEKKDPKKMLQKKIEQAL